MHHYESQKHLIMLLKNDNRVKERNTNTMEKKKQERELNTKKNHRLIEKENESRG